MMGSDLKIKPLDYKDCADATTMMWMENILTDAEYKRIMDKLNEAHLAKRL